MTIDELRDRLDEDALGQALYACVADLYPLCRSITGDGVRETLRRLQRQAPLTMHEVPSGTEVLDWTVPREWNIRDAYIKDARGERIVDFRRSNLHVVNYSVPVRRRMSLADLRPHLFTMPDRPAWIPYRTSYYQDGWGFCLSHEQLAALPEGEYEVCIDASLEPGALTYAEVCLPGESTDEILISCHICHPSLANDNLSGVAIAAHLAHSLGQVSRHYSYRFLFIPGTIGSITWLARNESVTPRIRHGLVLACLGDTGPLTYKKSRRGDATIDRAAAHVLRGLGDHTVLEFSPYGYDERQFCSPGFNLPVGRLSRTPHGCFPEYHTSADDLDFVHPSALAASFKAGLSILAVLEHDRIYVNQNPKGEPQLGKRGLYHAIGGGATSPAEEMAMLWVLNLADGRHRVLDMAERAGLSFDAVRAAARRLEAHGLLKEAASGPSGEDRA
jgi:aminopeptidase-like protein